MATTRKASWSRAYRSGYVGFRGGPRRWRCLVFEASPDGREAGLVVEPKECWVSEAFPGEVWGKLRDECEAVQGGAELSQVGVADGGAEVGLGLLAVVIQGAGGGEVVVQCFGVAAAVA